MRRRHFIVGLGGAVSGLAAGEKGARAAASAAPSSFTQFLAGVREEAEGRGIPASVLDPALGGLAPDPEVLARIAHQPEFTLSWPAYARRVITPGRIEQGRKERSRLRSLWPVLERNFGVPAGFLLGIWGIESNFGAQCGTFPAIRSLATLAYGSPRRDFFRGELLAALEILHREGFTPAMLEGSYAGALGQPQFMPSSYLRYAVDFNQDGSCDIWNDETDVLASIANFLQKAGWRPGLGWGARIAGAGSAGEKGPPRPGGESASLSRWRAEGVREAVALGPEDAPARLLIPRGSTERFLVTSNFDVIKTYNRSDFYALAVALLGERIMS